MFVNNPQYNALVAEARSATPEGRAVSTSGRKPELIKRFGRLSAGRQHAADLHERCGLRRSPTFVMPTTIRMMGWDRNDRLPARPGRGGRSRADDAVARAAGRRSRHPAPVTRLSFLLRRLGQVVISLAVVVDRDVPHRPPRARETRYGPRWGPARVRSSSRRTRAGSWGSTSRCGSSSPTTSRVSCAGISAYPSGHIERWAETVADRFPATLTLAVSGVRPSRLVGALAARDALRQVGARRRRPRTRRRGLVDCWEC